MPNPITFATDMKPLSPRLTANAVEPLENRISPAIIVLGTGGIPYSDTTKFTNVEDGIAAGDGISKVLGDGDPAANANVFYLRFKTGDLIALSEDFGSSTNYITGVGDGKPIKGNGIAVFADDGDGIVEPSELTGISLGKNAQVQVSNIVHGDVIANYNDATGLIGGASESPGVAKNLLLNPISFFGASKVEGNIVAGGTIKSINVPGQVGLILTGAAANNLSYDFNGSTIADGGDTLSFVPGAGKKGPNISKITVGDVTRIEAGGGGEGGTGGSISKVTLLADTTGWIIKAGNGGDGSPTKRTGGVGGSVSGIFANGLDATQSDSTLNDDIQVLGGNGGNGEGSAAGGKGGAVKNVSIGYEVGPNGGPTPSINTVSDSVLVAAGSGGTGKTGGKGAALTNIKVIASPTLSGNDITLEGGAGGECTVNGGKAGAGGNVTDFDIRNPGTSTDAQASRMFVNAGDGGLAGNDRTGANGGSTTQGTFVGFSVFATGGNGSTGSKGGSGGSVKNIRAIDGFGGVRAKFVAIDAGGGGTGLAGKGGNGGVIDGLNVLNPELSQFALNQTAGAGDGATSQKGPGGNGGGIFNLKVNDVDTVNPSSVPMLISPGSGGNGGGGSGGKGGSIGGSNVLSGINISLTATGGTGGNATGKGNGGVGGSISNLTFDSVSTQGQPAVTATITGGTGGTGVLSGKGGKGGALSSLSVLTDGDIIMQGGTGGLSASGTVGSGGSLNTITAISQTAVVNLTGGNAGATGGKAANGGSLTTVNAQALTSIALQGGNGSQGGSGGSIKEIGVYGVTSTTGTASGVSIIAGNGSGFGSKAGAGGSISGVDGFIATTGDTLIQAGSGGGVTSKAGAGGSVSEISLRGGGGLGAVVTINAGDAGDALGAKTGAKGGSVSEVGIGLNVFDPDAVEPDPFAVAPGTIIRHIAAGDGGDALTKGGAGGTVQNVRVKSDIGVMRGEQFGYSTMGGIFAGMGGSGGTAGTSGSVVSISADSIAAILAGKLETGDVIQQKNLAAAVDGIVLNFNVLPQVDLTGAYVNYDAAAIVGAIRNPEAANANKFEVAEFDDTGTGNTGVFGIGDTITTATDGFVAAVKFGTNKNNPTSIRPEAVLTLANGTSSFIDYLNNL